MRDKVDLNWKINLLSHSSENPFQAIIKSITFIKLTEIKYKK